MDKMTAEALTAIRQRDEDCRVGDERCRDPDHADRRALIAEVDRLTRYLRDTVAGERLFMIGIVNDEEEMGDGEIPDDLWARCATRAGASEVARAAVRAAKRNIIRRLAESGRARVPDVTDA